MPLLSGGGEVNVVVLHGEGEEVDEAGGVDVALLAEHHGHGALSEADERKERVPRLPHRTRYCNTTTDFAYYIIEWS